MKKNLFQALILDPTLHRMPPLETTDLGGRTVIITGANTGVGLEAAKHFARMGPARLIVTSRSEEKGRAAVAKVKEQTGYEGIELWMLDLSRFSSVIAFADKVEKEVPRLDLLVANAGVAPSSYALTPDGWEETLQVNYLSTALLCLLLTPRLVETARAFPEHQPRAVIVASEAQYFREFSEEVYVAEASYQVLNSKEYCSTKINIPNMDRYAESKLLDVFLAQSMADMLKDTPVIVTSVTPGYCSSELGRHTGGIGAYIAALIQYLFSRSCEEGARQLVYAAIGSSDNPDKLRGEYIALSKVEESNDHTLGEEGKKRRDKLWGDLIRELAKVDERVPAIVKEFETK